MIFAPTPIEGAYLVEAEPRADDRGWFARLWCADELAAQGLDGRFVQCNGSFSARRGTLRGLHYQAAPHGECKLVRCVAGSIFDVVADVRPDSPSRGRWWGTTLLAGDRRMVYVPEGCAHGYLALEDATEVVYPVTARYQPGAERGVRWNDPAFGIAWPPTDTLTLSEKDQRWPDFAA